ncbi:vitamin K epoxide reductase family protein [Methylomonas sp. AM2-LC]|uniref:vitamin K epoxide reductase family protein n=1 Tax=Methylomonas sp. AM2-LC TaxID=3153301 RepID=UPI0032652856
MRLAAKTIFAASTIGMLNAGYLTYLYWQETADSNVIGLCDINSTLSCSSVISSPYAQFLGVPVCSIALFVYPILMVLAWQLLSKTHTRNRFYAITIIAAMGLMLNLVYVYNEVVYIQKLCPLCLFCTLLILTDFLMAIRGYLRSTQ